MPHHEAREWFYDARQKIWRRRRIDSFRGRRRLKTFLRRYFLTASFIENVKALILFQPLVLISSGMRAHSAHDDAARRCATLLARRRARMHECLRAERAAIIDIAAICREDCARRRASSMTDSQPA